VTQPSNGAGAACNLNTTDMLIRAGVRGGSWDMLRVGRISRWSGSFWHFPLWRVLSSPTPGKKQMTNGFNFEMATVNFFRWKSVVATWDFHSFKLTPVHYYSQVKVSWDFHGWQFIGRCNDKDVERNSICHRYNTARLRLSHSQALNTLNTHWTVSLVSN
jgi:hypothetical protein